MSNEFTELIKRRRIEFINKIDVDTWDFKQVEEILKVIREMNQLLEKEKEFESYYGHKERSYGGLCNG